MVEIQNGRQMKISIFQKAIYISVDIRPINIKVVSNDKFQGEGIQLHRQFFY